MKNFYYKNINCIILFILFNISNYELFATCFKYSINSKANVIELP